MSPSAKIYSTPTCPWCQKAKEFLRENNIAFQDLSVAGDQAARREVIAKTNKMTVPVVEIDGEITVGYNENWLRQKLGLTKKKGLN